MKKIVCILLALTAASAIQGWSIGGAIHSATHHISHAAHEAADHAREAADHAREAAEAAARKSKEEAEAAAKKADEAAKAAAKKAQEVAKKAEEASKKATNIAERAVSHIKDVANKAVSGIHDLAKTVNEQVIQKVTAGIKQAIATIKTLLGKGGPKPDYMKIYGDALNKAFEQYKDKDDFNVIAYKILAAMALNKELEMHKHISFEQFKQLFTSYNLGLQAQAIEALKAAFENGTAIPAGIGPKPDMSKVLFATFKKVVTAQLPGFIAQYKQAFADQGMSDYLSKNPKMLNSAQAGFIADIWEKGAAKLKQFDVDWPTLYAQLKEYQLAQKQLDEIKAALEAAAAA